MLDRQIKFTIIFVVCVFMGLLSSTRHFKGVFGALVKDHDFYDIFNISPSVLIGHPIWRKDADAPQEGNASRDVFAPPDNLDPHAGASTTFTFMTRPVGKRDDSPDFPFYDHEVAKVADTIFFKLKTFDDCIYKFLGFSNLSRRKISAAKQECLILVFVDLEKLLNTRGTAEVGYGGIESESGVWEEKGAHYVRAGRAAGGGWFFVRKGLERGGVEDESEDDDFQQ